MSNEKLVSIEPVLSLEHYAASLMYSVYSLKTLEAVQAESLSQGILDQDEMEAATTITWEIRRLLMLYVTQMKNVLDRTGLSEEEILIILKTRIPDLKIPEKKE